MVVNRGSLATQNRRHLKAISEFANMGDSTERWRAFHKRWPALLPADLYTDSENEIQQNIERAQSPFTSLSPGIAPTVWEITGTREPYRVLRPTADPSKWVDYKEPEILRLRNLLRDAWSGGRTAQPSIEELLGLHSASPSVSANWRRGSLVFLPRSPFQEACYALLLNAGLAKFCANPECPAPYFVARRATRRYCSPDCLKPFQKQWKLDWWNRTGKTRRAKASTKSRKRR